MGRKLILSCSKRKTETADFIPALERYDGVAFRLLRRYFKNFDEKLEVYILSAEFGLISQNRKIPNYDTQMTRETALKLKRKILSQADKLLAAEALTKRDEIFINLGRNYELSFSKVFGILETKACVTTASGSIGKRLSQMHDWIYIEQAGMHREFARAEKPVSFSGEKFSFTPEQIYQCAREGLKNDLARASGFQSWFVEVDGVRISPKWLVNRLTGVSVSSFHSDAARRILQQLGVEVKRV